MPTHLALILLRGIAELAEDDNVTLSEQVCLFSRIVSTPVKRQTCKHVNQVNVEFDLNFLRALAQLFSEPYYKKAINKKPKNVLIKKAKKKYERFSAALTKLLWGDPF